MKAGIRPRQGKRFSCLRFPQPALAGLTAFLIPLLIPGAARAETPLVVKDPNASFLDVAARRQALRNAQNPLLRDALANLKGCVGAPFPALPPHGQDIPSRYQSSSHGELNPLEHQLSEPYYMIQEIAAQGADKYLATGDPAEANCVIQALLAWVQDKAALLDYNAKDDMVVWFQSTWTVASLSLSVSIIRSEPRLNAADRDRVIAWLHSAALKAVSESRGPTSGTSTNNHFFWRGLAATAAGVISGDNKLFAQGLRTYATAIGEMDDQGAFPDEMARHELALHYQAYAIEPLVMIAELAYRQGLNIYPLEQRGHRLSDAVNFLSRALADPSLIRKYTPEAQKIDPDFLPGSALLSWTELWTARTGDPAWQEYMVKPFFDSRLAGSTTLFAAPVQAPRSASPAGPNPPSPSK
ncbi:MAG: alginate lyase family protein [Terracidiphilus sp.]